MAVYSSGHEIVGAKIFTNTPQSPVSGDYSNLNGKYLPITTNPKIDVNRPTSIRQYKNDPGSASFIATRRSKYHDYTAQSAIKDTTASFDIEISALTSNNFPGLSIFSLVGYYTSNNSYVITRDITNKVPNINLTMLGKNNEQFILQNSIATTININMTTNAILNASVTIEGDNFLRDNSGTDTQTGTPVHDTIEEAHNQINNAKPFVLRELTIEITDKNNPNSPTITTVCPTEFNFSVKSTKSSVEMLSKNMTVSTLLGVNIEGSFKVLVENGDYLAPDLVETEAIHKRQVKVILKDTENNHTLFFNFPELVITNVQDGDGFNNNWSTREYTFVCLPDSVGNILGVNDNTTLGNIVTHYGTIVTQDGVPVSNTP